MFQTMAGEQYASISGLPQGTEESNLCINCKVLLAAWLALQCYQLREMSISIYEWTTLQQ